MGESYSSTKLALEKSQIKYKIAEGDGAFYGPKIDFHVTDSIGRNGNVLPYS